MSSLQKFSEAGKFSGKAPEKSNFAQTCNLLSQYIKEKGSLRDLNLGMNGNLETMGKSETSQVTATRTMNLLASLEKSSQACDLKTMDDFSQYAVVGSSSSSKLQATSEPKTAQMTIFYAGQVLVFHDLPAEKAREIMLLANNGSFPNTSGFASTSAGDNILSGGSMANDLNIVPHSESNPAQERIQRRVGVITSDLPLARRASLHRFLGKRKERAIASAPYQVLNPSASSSKIEEQLELKL